MKTEKDIKYIYQKLSDYWPKYSDRKPDAKIHNKAYMSLIGVMLSAQSQDSRTAVACDQLFSLARTPEEMLKLTQQQIIEAIKPAGLYKIGLDYGFKLVDGQQMQQLKSKLLGVQYED